MKVSNLMKYLASRFGTALAIMRYHQESKMSSSAMHVAKTGLNSTNKDAGCEQSR